MLSTHTHPNHPQTHAMPTRVTYSPYKVNTNTKTIHIVRCLVIPPALSLP
nr:MAG TPA: hypothetical protein [Caudoviricetes sp.]